MLANFGSFQLEETVSNLSLA